MLKIRFNLRFMDQDFMYETSREIKSLVYLWKHGIEKRAFAEHVVAAISRNGRGLLGLVGRLEELDVENKI